MRMSLPPPPNNSLAAASPVRVSAKLLPIEILDAGEAIAFGVPSRPETGDETDPHAVRRAGIGRGVVADPACERVGAGTTVEFVIAFAAIEDVITRVPPWSQSPPMLPVMVSSPPTSLDAHAAPSFEHGDDVIVVGSDNCRWYVAHGVAPF